MTSDASPAPCPTRLLFLPGAGGSPEFWQPVADLLVHPASRRLLGWPGCGALPHDPGVRSLVDLVDRVTAEIDQPTALIAQSMGGVVAVLAALRQPRLVTHLVLAATSGGVDLSDFDVEDWRPAFFEAQPGAPRWFADDASDVSASLQRLCLPVLLLWGGADRISPVEVGYRLKQALSNSRIEVLAGGAHDFAHRLAARVALLIDEHLAAVA